MRIRTKEQPFGINKLKHVFELGPSHGPKTNLMHWTSPDSKGPYLALPNSEAKYVMIIAS